LLFALAVAFVSAMGSGCLLTEAEKLPGPYFEYDGMWCTTVNARFLDARAATVAALADLQMPLAREGRNQHGGFVDCLGPDEIHVRIHIEPLGSGHRVEADFCRICVRVGGFGTHRPLCERILDAINHHLVPAAAVSAPPAAGTAASRPGAGAPPQPSPPATGSALPAQPVPVAK
jgi:hypothetical protein